MEHEGVPISAYPCVRALYAYKARSSKELSFNADDLLTILDITSETWWEGAFAGKKGYIPAAYVEHTPVDAASGARRNSNGSGGDTASLHIDLAPAPPPPLEDLQEGGEDGDEDMSTMRVKGSVDERRGKRGGLSAALAAASASASAAPGGRRHGHESDGGVNNSDNEHVSLERAPSPPLESDDEHNAGAQREDGEVAELNRSKSQLLSELSVEIRPRGERAEAHARPVSVGAAGLDEDPHPRTPARPMTPDRPDMVSALRIHKAQSKHKDLLPKKGQNEIQQQLSRMKHPGSQKQQPEDEFSRAMRKQQDRLDSTRKEQERMANMSELEKKFMGRRAGEQ